MSFAIKSSFTPTGDQPQAIEKLVAGIRAGVPHQTLLGVTGSGKTFTMANVIAEVKHPTLVISHNKTLAAQLAGEFEEFFPDAAVHYFVSYYDYYQPEAYVPTTDTYIEKETDINEEIDRLRHAATQALLSRKDVIIVASVSCIYGLGSPEEYQFMSLELKTSRPSGIPHTLNTNIQGAGQNSKLNRIEILRKLVDMRYERNDMDLQRGRFRVRGNMIDIYPVYSLEDIWRIEFSGNAVQRISALDQLTGKTVNRADAFTLFPATHYIAPQERINEILKTIEQDLDREVRAFLKANKPLEAERLSQRVHFDLEMIRATGYCNGIENYSRYFDQRKPGEPPSTLIDFFRFADKDFLTFIDESHMTLPQLRGMYHGDRARKDTLIEYGFRLTGARDNRPLTFDEFNTRIGQVIYVSATPNEYELSRSRHPHHNLPLSRGRSASLMSSPLVRGESEGGRVVEQLIRPTGLLDPTITVKPTKNQIDDLLNEIHHCIAKKQRVLVTTLTKRMAEDLAEYLEELKVKAAYLHSDIETFERLELLRDLRLGVYDVLVGINLLREGLDLPEVALVAILDADKEGFLRSATSLVQVMGRAARHLEGRVIMYADTITGSMKQAMEETKRRRAVQEAYNKKHGITPATIKKAIKEGILAHRQSESFQPKLPNIAEIPYEELPHLIRDLERQMDLAAKNLEFEKAAALRDQIKIMKEKMRKKTSRRDPFKAIRAAKEEGN
ncbi:MAG: excinuclease ABC subunit UvrB [Patescibacteria group bacterium]